MRRLDTLQPVGHQSIHAGLLAEKAADKHSGWTKLLSRAESAASLRLCREPRSASHGEVFHATAAEIRGESCQAAVWQLRYISKKEKKGRGVKDLYLGAICMDVFTVS